MENVVPYFKKADPIEGRPKLLLLREDRHHMANIPAASQGGWGLGRP